MPPAAPTRDDAMRKFSMRGARLSKLAMAAAPLSSLILLYRANDLRWYGSCPEADAPAQQGFHMRDIVR